MAGQVGCNFDGFGTQSSQLLYKTKIFGGRGMERDPSDPEEQDDVVRSRAHAQKKDWSVVVHDSDGR
eukprot:1140065-Pelagomonas_calceolata.AAC.4